MSRDGERRYSSTRWVYGGERISSSARGKGQQPRSGYRWFGLALAPPSRKLTLTITYKGGAECWYLVQARGRHGMFPGVAALHDVIREVRQTG